MNTRFAVATHMMIYLAFAHEHGRPTNSESIAQMIGTNPVVVRRLIGNLRGAELVRTQLGAGGGAQLARCPESISLLDVYRAIEPPEEQDLFSLGQLSEHAHCHEAGSRIQHTLKAVFGRAEAAMHQELAQVSLLNVMEHMREHGSCNAHLPPLHTPAIS